MKVIFIGPPGSGKGTQAKRLADRFDIPHVSTGDMLRQAVQSGTALGKEAAPIMAAGALVPDELMIGIIQDRLSEADATSGYVLDGFPRTTEQAQKLEPILRGNEGASARVLQLLVPDDLIVGRLSGRLSCIKCGSAYHQKNNPPKVANVCDRCGSELTVRPDDTEQAVRKRLESFHRQTLPVVAFYRDKNVLHEVDGNASVDQVFERIERLVGE
ncbi:MAG TPA: adenylate kinase [Thermoanaerobaculia bacterium]|nr:adenylate kinase [Thermoanaerobaculia bacterium]